jgi:hypothetical protein
MLFESLSWVMLTLTLFAALPGALASPSPKSKKKTHSRVRLEVYPAMEDGEIVREALPQTRAKKIAKTSNQKKNRRVQTLGVPAPIDHPISAPAAYVLNDANSTPESAVVPRSHPAFDTVPADKRPQVLRRMELCQSLFEESGRAYDYRTMTTAQLQKELEAVRAGERPVAVRDAAGVKPSQYVPVNAVPETESDPILDAQE